MRSTTKIAAGFNPVGPPSSPDPPLTHQKTNQLIGRSHRYARKPASRALPSSKVQLIIILVIRLAQHLPFITALRKAWCKQCLPCRRKPDLLIVGMRGSMAMRSPPVRDLSTCTPLPPPLTPSTNSNSSYVERGPKTDDVQEPFFWDVKNHAICGVF